MDTLETKRQDMFGRVREFGSERKTQFPADSYAGELFVNLGALIEELNALALSQSTGKSSVRESASSKAAVRDELKRRLEAISRTARAMAHAFPGLEDKFRAPRSVSDQALLILARTFAADAGPLKAEFIRRGLAATFIEDLGALTEEFEAAINRKNQGRGAHVAATAAIDEKIERGLQIVRELDAIVRNTYAGDHATLAAWESASHVEKVSRSSKKKGQGTTTTPASN